MVEKKKWNGDGGYDDESALGLAGARIFFLVKREERKKKKEEEKAHCTIGRPSRLDVDSTRLACVVARADL